ncbi:MAG: phosphonate C-P lyase system protein PhnL [Phenylobacterium sp.]|uniref:phosphonate C-P lyase system protein PhnL n=1 Tax=Phenylobacterium sp. TaxID=1871053 RepID=UPI0025D78090|nr:phosphonate C-P lyase system protein PhnL [Phenylobacterium sp.]MCG9916174.1 phosphonate C-P lyase system protein PhnL [Phenylobacterium sp.]
MTDKPLIIVEDLAKTFVLHNAEQATIPVFQDLTLQVAAGECVVLAGESGVGKSTLMRSIFGNYLPTVGSVKVWHDGTYVDITQASPHEVLEVRRRTLGYVSQFLRVIPRVPTLQLVMEPLLENGVSFEESKERASELLSALRLPQAHWDLPPATFSGGEQQRVNIARSFIRKYPVLLLDEPTASLDAENRAIVVRLIQEALAEGAAMIGIFHDLDVRDAVASRLFEVAQFKAAA